MKTIDHSLCDLDFQTMFHRLPICTIIFLVGTFFLSLSTLLSYSTLKNVSSPDDVLPQPSSIPADDDINVLCEKYSWNMKASSNNNPSLPIYDFILFSSEFDLLEIRLYELYDYVTLFFIAESAHTLTGHSKPLHLKENWSRFARYHAKIRRIEVSLIANISDPWQNEGRMRREGHRLALENLSTTSPFLLLTSDVDEIPKAEFMRSLMRCSLPNPFNPFVLQCDFYYYSFEFKNEQNPWTGPTLTYVDSLSSRNISAETLRKDRFDFRLIPQSCYHCTWCFNDLNEVRFKMSAYSHTEHNQLQFRTRKHIIDRYRHGKDLFDRADQIYVFQENNHELPQLLKTEPNRFMYMIRRSNMTNAGFIKV